ncbi:MAG: helix-turn-helix transcriptional regulator [Lachnospiraceae bacterium]|nr:helix-turn-helix transcriptional regulator [Lachnospiraceae bacterium]
MNSLSIAENIIKLRHEKGITQNELAAFLGVTKASVSKWETKQSYPDILLIPQIATFFNVTTDELLGYHPQLAREQIQKHYINLAADFTRLPFDAVISKCEKLIKEYYACYPFLSQMALLYLNHFMIAETPERQKEILEQCITLCSHIETNCKQPLIKEEACIFKAIANLQLNKPQEVIETLTPFEDPKQVRTSAESLLVQAYHMLGQTEQADYHCQFYIYSHLLSLISESTLLLSLHMEQPDYCRETIKRIEQMIIIYQLEYLHPNVCLQFYYQAALFYAGLSDKNNILPYLKCFASVSINLLENNLTLHGDRYFTQIDKWVSNLTLGAQAPRDKEAVAQSCIECITNPAFSILFEDVEYKNLKLELERKLFI